MARFLMAWWNGDDLAHVPIADLFGADNAIAADIVLILSWLGTQPTAVYPNAFGRRDEIQTIIERWSTVDAA